MAGDLYGVFDHHKIWRAERIIAGAMQPLPKAFRITLIVAGLLCVVAAPGTIAGYLKINEAESALAAEDYAGAAAAFESAAQRIFWRSDLWERAAQAALAAGQPEDTIRLLEGRAGLSQAGQLVLAGAHLQTGDLDAALNAYQSALAVFGGSAEIHGGLADVHRAEGDWDSERTALQNKLLFAADDAPAHYRLGLLLTLSDTDGALEHLVLASRLDPEFDPVTGTLRTALNLSRLQASRAESLVTIGRGLGLAAEWPLAAEAFDQAAGADPGHAEAWAWLGEAKQHLGQDGRADLDRALSLDPGSVVVRALRGLYWKRVGNTREALTEYQAAAALEPANPAWKTALGETYARSGDLVSALAVYQTATELAPQDATVWRLLAMFCVEYNVQVQEVGLPAAQQAVDLAPEDALALDVLGWNQLSLGWFYSAEQTLLRALELAPDHPAAHLHLALVYLQKGDRTAAHDHLVRVRTLDPEGVSGVQAERILSQYFQ